MQETDEYDDLPDDVERGTIGSILFDTKDDEAEAIIPFESVHNPPVEFKSRKRKIFIPNTPITVRIIKYERSVTTHLLHPYLYTIQLEHGNFSWVIQKRYKNVQFLHQQLKLFRATLMIPFPTEKHRCDRENLKELKKSEDEAGKSKSSLPRKSFENFDLDLTLFENGGFNFFLKSLIKQVHAEVNIYDVSCGVGLSCLATFHGAVKYCCLNAARKTRVIRHTRFPNRPEVLIGYDQIDKRVQQLEDYLNKLLSIKLYRDHPETIEFLSVSHFSFVRDLGVKGKEEFIEKQTGSRQRSCDCFGICEKLDCCVPCSDFCTYNCNRWKKRWLFIKDTFLGYVRARDGLLRGVILFDQEFEVASAFSNIRRRDKLQILNLQRRLLIKCDGSRKRQELANFIKETTKKQGYGFTHDNKYSSFAPKRSDCTASWYVDGATYMYAVADAINNAKEEIFITDWWLSPEIYLKRPVIRGNHEWRLDCLLQKKANEGVKIFVLLYKEVKQALGLDSYYSRNTLRKLHSENIKVLRHPDHAKSGVFLWAHHEKIVCIDQTIAFLGGIDLCYGRWDTFEHRLADFGGVHMGTCSFPGCKASFEQGIRNEKLKCLQGKKTIVKDPSDLSKDFVDYEASRVEDFSRKQERDDNTLKNGGMSQEEIETQKEKDKKTESETGEEEQRCETPELEKKSFFDRIGECCAGHCFTAFSNEVPAEKTVELIAEQIEKREILPSELGRNDSQDELTAPPVVYWIGKDYTNFILKDFCNLDAPFQDLFDRMKTPRMPWHDVGVMVHGTAARDVARHFIQRWNAVKIEKVKKLNFYPYLLPKSYEHFDSPPKYLCDEQFKVKCQVLRSVSAWSGGFLNPEAYEESIHQAYLESILKSKYYIYIENQFFISLVRQNDYVKNRIVEELCSRIVRAHNDNKKFRVYIVIPLLPGFEGEIGERSGTSLHAITHWNYSSICRGSSSLLERLKELGIEDPSEYITFHGLRKYSEFHDDFVSELIYVHSKLMIVDDKVVICGSANINDRSLLGSRDSEIAVIIKDEEFEEGFMNKEKVPVGRYASSLRKYLFMEHLGLLNYDLCPKHAAGEHLKMLDVIDPVSDEFYKEWVSTSRSNTKIFEEVFRCYPSDRVTTFREFRLYNREERLLDSDPEKAKELLKEVKGHLVDLPLNFLKNEDLTPKLTDGVTGLMPMTLWT